MQNGIKNKGKHYFLTTYIIRGRTPPLSNIPCANRQTLMPCLVFLPFTVTSDENLYSLVYRMISKFEETSLSKVCVGEYTWRLKR